MMPPTRKPIPATMPTHASQRRAICPKRTDRPRARSVVPLSRWKKLLRAFSVQRTPSATRKAADLSVAVDACAQVSTGALERDAVHGHLHREDGSDEHGCDVRRSPYGGSRRRNDVGRQTYSRARFKTYFTPPGAAEAALVPQGRAKRLRRYGAFTAAIALGRSTT